MNEILLFSLYLIVFTTLMLNWRFFKVGIDSRLLIFAFIMKTISGFCIAYIYGNYYSGGDTNGYMFNARLMYSLLHESPAIYFQFISGIEIDKTTLLYYYEKFAIINHGEYNKLFPNPLVALRINAFLCIFSLGFYYVQMFLLSFLSMIGLTALFKMSMKYFACNKWLLFIACFCLPSVMAWGSSVLQEPLILFFIGVIIYGFSIWTREGNKYGLFMLIAAGILLFGMKPYIIIIMFPGLITCMLLQGKKRSASLVIISSYIIAFVISILISKVNDRFNVFRALNDQQIIAMKNAVYYESKSLIDLIPFAPNPTSIIKRIPDAIIVALTRPHFSECKNMLQYFAASENYLILVFLLILLLAIDFNKLKANPLMLVSIISGSIIIIVAAYTCPVLGTMVRMKMPGILLITFGLASCTRTKALTNVW